MSWPCPSMELFITFASILLAIFHGICTKSQNVTCPSDIFGNEWFGPSCNFQCHCLDRKCDSSTGNCSSGCRRGYFGPACQYFSAAYGQLPTQSRTAASADRAVDGYEATCSRTTQQMKPYWKVDLLTTTWLLWVDIRLSADLGTRKMSLFVNTADEKAVLCNASHTMVDTSLLRITCSTPLKATGIFLIATDSEYSQLVLCEVYVYAGRNIAVHKTTRQSSVYQVYNSSLAVDGHRSSMFTDRSCTHTDDSCTGGEGNKDVSWMVSLGGSYQLYTAVVYNRRGPNKRRLNGFRIRVGGSDTELIRVHADVEEPAREVTSVVMPANQTGNRVEVLLRGVCRVLTLCEVVVMGDCFNGNYGLECSSICTCRNQQEVCNKVDGSCVSGCPDGFIGIDCKETCSSGTFGLACRKICTEGCAGQTCEGATGKCLSCPAGRHGDFCEATNLVPDHMIVVIVAVVTIVVALVIVSVAICLVRRRRRKRRRPDVIPDIADKDVPEEPNIGLYENISLGKLCQDNASDVTDEPGVDDCNDTKETSNLSLHLESCPQPPPEETDDCLTYTNSCAVEDSHMIDVADLPQYMAEWRHDGSDLEQQFKSLPRDLQTDIPQTFGAMVENRKKNRYKNICAYDHSRVKLDVQGDDATSDYINACYIQGYSKNEVFIASQGPTKKMMEDFVRMLWEQHVPIVVMLTRVIENGTRKCEQYWSIDEDLEVGEFWLTVLNTEEFADYTVRRLQISRPSSSDSADRLVMHYHYTTWPDKGVPMSPVSLMYFRNKVMTPDRKQGPIVVHCSAGVGRTGTFIGLDCLLRMADEVGHVDVHECVARMRRARVNMVQTLDQYIFLHECLAVSNLLPLRVHRREFLERRPIQDESLVAELMNLNSFISSETSALHNTSPDGLRSAASLANIEDIVSMASQVSDGIDYSGIFFVPSYWHYKAFLVMATPEVEHAEEYFQWMMDTDAEIVVTLDQLDSELCPLVGQEKTFGSCHVTCTGEDVRGRSVRKTVVVREEDMEHEFLLLTCPAWADSTNLCDTPQIVLDFVRDTQQLMTDSKPPVVVQSSPAHGNAGLFCCMSLILEMVDQDQSVAIPHVVSQVRAHIPEVIRSQTEYNLLYDCVGRHLDSEAVYCNYNPGQASQESTRIM